MSDESDAPDVEGGIVDADVHVAVAAEAMADHADEPVRSRLLNSYAFPTVGGSDWDPSMGGAIEGGDPIGSPDDVERFRESFGVERPILNPTLGLGKVSKPELAAELMCARNRAFVDRYLDGTDHVGLGVITTKAPDVVAEEVRRLGDEPGIVGLVVESLGTRTAFGDPSLDPIYAAAEGEGLPIAVHTSAAGEFMYSFPIQDKAANTFLEAHTLAHRWGPESALTSLLVGGVPAKFPDLEFVFLESGVSWVPGLIWRLDRARSMRDREAPLLSAPPSEYVRDRFHFSTHPSGEVDPESFRSVVDAVGADSLVFSSGYPGWDFETPATAGRTLDAFPPEGRDRVFGGTAAEVFGLDR